MCKRYEEIVTEAVPLRSLIGSEKDGNADRAKKWIADSPQRMSSQTKQDDLQKETGICFCPSPGE